MAVEWCLVVRVSGADLQRTRKMSTTNVQVSLHRRDGGSSSSRGLKTTKMVEGRTHQPLFHRCWYIDISCWLFNSSIDIGLIRLRGWAALVAVL